MSKKHDHKRENARRLRAIARLEKRGMGNAEKVLINNTLKNMGQQPKYDVKPDVEKAGKEPAPGPRKEEKPRRKKRGAPYPGDPVAG